MDAEPMSNHKRQGSGKRTLAIFILALMIGLTYSLYPMFASPAVDPVKVVINEADQPQLPGTKGHVRAWVDGQLVVDEDNVITYNMFNWIACKLFNYTSGTSAGCGYSLGAGGYTTNNTAAHGIELSTTGTTPSASQVSCPGGLSANGLGPVIGTKTYTASSRQITLTGTWTATADQNNIQRACLRISTATWAATYTNPVAQTTFTAINLANGQSLTIEWTISW